MAEKNSNINTKLVQIMKDCAYVQKDSENSFHRYKYASAAAVLEKINQALVKYGVASTVNAELLSLLDVVTAKGNTEHLATVKVEIKLTDADNSTSVTFTGLGSGQDVGDKAVMKAQTAAIKYAYLLGLCIATGDDPEADTRTDENTSSTTKTDCNKPNTRKEDDYIPFSDSTAYESNECSCSVCRSKVSTKVAQYSRNRFGGRVLCFNCQKGA